MYQAGINWYPWMLISFSCLEMPFVFCNWYRCWIGVRFGESSLFDGGWQSSCVLPLWHHYHVVSRRWFAGRWLIGLLERIASPSWLGNPFGIPRNSTINPIPDLLNSRIIIGIFFFWSLNVFPPILNTFFPVWNPLPPSILPISWIGKRSRHQYFFGPQMKISSHIS